MSVADIYEKRATFSFEVFPPKTDVGMEKLCGKDGVLEKLYTLNPDYISCTYGAGGTNVGKNLEVLDKIVKDGKTTPVGAYLVKVLTADVEAEDKIDLRTNTAATEIVMEDGKAVGVKVKSENGEYTIRAKAVILASGGYPLAYEKGKEITGLTAGQLDAADVTVYHAGTAIKDGRLVTNGGRVLGVTATANTLPEALKKAYAATESIHFDKLHKRSDIGARALAAMQ